MRMPCAHFPSMRLTRIQFVGESFAQCGFFRSYRDKIVRFTYNQWFGAKLITCVANAIAGGNKICKGTIQDINRALHGFVQGSSMLHHISNVNSDYLGIVVSIEVMAFYFEAAA